MTYPADVSFCDPAGSGLRMDEPGEHDPSIDGFQFAVPTPPEGMPDWTSTRFKMPDWQAAPSNWLPGDPGLTLVAARGDEAVVQLRGFRAYPTGFEFELFATARNPRPELDHGMFGHPPGMPGTPGVDSLSDALLRIAFVYADGSSASSVGGFPMFGPGGQSEPPGPLMMQNGGGGGGGDYRWSYWCWPLPPAGPVRVVCEWPLLGFERVVTEFDASAIRDAADRAEQLWDDPPPMPDFQHGFGVNVS